MTYYLSEKERKNVPSIVYEKSIGSVFLGTKNILYCTKEIFLLHTSNHGLLNYLYFRSIVPKRMLSWISKFKPPQSSNGIDMLKYLNKTFIQHQQDLYEFKCEDKIDVLVDRNVYKQNKTIHLVDEFGNNAEIIKRPKDMMASDYSLLDVWREQTTEISNEQQRYGNKIPVWQRSLNSRHYDLGNEGYSASKERSSLNTNVYGYGSAMAELEAKKAEQYKKNYMTLYGLERH
jgi:hypothetical protein